MVDADGFRANVGIVLTDGQGKLFWAKKIGADIWQFPQGGIRRRESIKMAMYRELREETGLRPEHVAIIAYTNKWRRYRLPKRLIRRKAIPVCIGQKQIWYLLKLLASEDKIHLNYSKQAEFECWKWIDIDQAIKEVAVFKRKVYEKTLNEFEPLLF